MVILLTLLDVQEEVELDLNWNSEIDSIFSIPPASKKTKSSTSITSHRLLTSDAVIKMKRERLEEKKRKEREKEERKLKASQKRKQLRK